MRKVIVSMNVTLDGFMAGPSCELDWHFRSWTEDMSETASRLLAGADTILLGRVTYQAMAGYWPLVPADLSHDRSDLAYAEMMNNYTKVVFSATLKEANWKNTRLIRGRPGRELAKLKADPAGENKDIMVYGSGTLVEQLIRLGLVDEYLLWLHPVLIGAGRPLFGKVKRRQGLDLLATEVFRSGVVLLRYRAVSSLAKLVPPAPVSAPS